MQEKTCCELQINISPSPPPSSSPLKGEEMRCGNPALKGEENEKKVNLHLRGRKMR